MSKLTSTGERLEQLVENAAIVTYCKLGGHPWLLAGERNPEQLIVGIGHAIPRGSRPVNRSFRAIATVFENTGAFVEVKYSF